MVWLKELESVNLKDHELVTDQEREMGSDLVSYWTSTLKKRLV